MADGGEMPGPDQLTEEQQRFVDEYLIDYCGTQAYRRAYPRSTYATARTEASRLLAKPNIAAEIKAAKAARSRRLRLSADRVTREIERIAFADLLEVENPDGSLRRLRDIPIDLRRAISSVKVRREKTVTRTSGDTETDVTAEVIEYKLWSKPDALEKLSKRLGLSQEITSLDALLLAIPEHLRDGFRQALEAAVRPRGGGAAGDEDDLDRPD